MAHVYIRTLNSTGRSVVLDYVQKDTAADRAKLASYRALHKDSTITKGHVDQYYWARLGEEFALPAAKSPPKFIHFSA